MPARGQKGRGGGASALVPVPVPPPLSMTRRALLIAIEGPSGAGKTTLARRTAERFGWRLLPEAYDRLSPRPSLRFAGPAGLLALERRLLAEERRRYAEALRSTAAGTTVLADTGFLGPLTYTAGLVARGAAPGRLLTDLLEEEQRARSPRAAGLPDVVVYLDVPSRLARRRGASDPAGHPADLAGRHAAIGAWERRFYRRVLGPAFPSVVRTVPASGAPRSIARRLEAAVRSSVPLAHPRDAARVARTLLGGLVADGRPPRDRARSAATVKKPARSRPGPSR